MWGSAQTKSHAFSWLISIGFQAFQKHSSVILKQCNSHTTSCSFNVESDGSVHRQRWPSTCKLARGWSLSPFLTSPSWEASVGTKPCPARADAVAWQSIDLLCMLAQCRSCSLLPTYSLRSDSQLSLCWHLKTIMVKCFNWETNQIIWVYNAFVPGNPCCWAERTSTGGRQLRGTSKTLSCGGPLLDKCPTIAAIREMAPLEAASNLPTCRANANQTRGLRFPECMPVKAMSHGDTYA